MRFYDVDVGVNLIFEGNIDGAVPDLNGVTVHLLVQGVSKSPCFCINVPSVKGRATYTVLAGDFAPGEYVAQVRYTFSATTRVLHTAPFGLTVKSLYN